EPQKIRRLRPVVPAGNYRLGSTRLSSFAGLLERPHMDESQDSAVFAAECVTVGLSRAEYVQQVLSAARATLARSRADNQFRERPAEPPSAPEWRSRERPLTSRDRAPAAPAPAPQPDAPTWEQERTAVFDAICALRQLCEALSDHLAD